MYVGGTLLAKHNGPRWRQSAVTLWVLAPPDWQVLRASSERLARIRVVALCNMVRTRHVGTLQEEG